MFQSPVDARLTISNVFERFFNIDSRARLSRALAHSIFSLSSLNIPHLSRVRNASIDIDVGVQSRASLILRRIDSSSSSSSTSTSSTTTNSSTTTSAVIGSRSTSLTPYQSLFVQSIDPIDEGSLFL